MQVPRAATMCSCNTTYVHTHRIQILKEILGTSYNVSHRACRCRVGGYRSGWSYTSYMTSHRKIVKCMISILPSWLYLRHLRHLSKRLRAGSQWTGITSIPLCLLFLVLELVRSTSTRFGRTCFLVCMTSPLPIPPETACSPRYERAPEPVSALFRLPSSYWSLTEPWYRALYSRGLSMSRRDHMPLRCLFALASAASYASFNPPYSPPDLASYVVANPCLIISKPTLRRIKNRRT